MNENTTATATATETLSAEMIQAIKDAGGQNIYVLQEYSRSGMSRRLAFYMVFNGDLIAISRYIRPNLSPDSNFFRVNGCGFDAPANILSSFYGRNGIPINLAYRYNRMYTK